MHVRQFTLPNANQNLSQEWQTKLSLLKVSDFPWEPKPPPAVKEQSIPPNVKPPPQTLPSNGNLNAGGPQSSLKTLPPVKSEAGAFPSPQSHGNYPSSFPPGQPMTAQERAAMNLHNAFGERAGAQVAELQQGLQRHAPGPQQPMHPGPFIKQEDASGEAYRSNVPQQPTPIPRDPIKSDQTDGTGDTPDTWQAEYSRRKADIAVNREQNDRIIRDHVAASQQRLEGGGVMMPLDEIHLHGRPPLQDPSDRGETSASVSRAQGDAAGDDDDEEDEDAINSDLDDPDELDEDAAEGEESTDQVMLCTYDKVQRVKNKWKCTLKDGILRMQGSEMLFHKGSGEFEW